MKTKIAVPLTLLFLGVTGIGLDYFNVVNYPEGDPVSNIAYALIVVAMLLFFVRNKLFRYGYSVFGTVTIDCPRR